ncbi:hypothetical protein QJS04_geneDACA010937 [Acorus gramineus]|uniref:Uncharacterized protein n=1 Tax=Acorus gramineus TaxID=55184 RepID=A0AAV9BI69_ACOGR|nr:hypothetical protein QJS04_geneDACA010937 [Acorus gramineus]
MVPHSIEDSTSPEETSPSISPASLFCFSTGASNPKDHVLEVLLHPQHIILDKAPKPAKKMGPAKSMLQPGILVPLGLPSKAKKNIKKKVMSSAGHSKASA